MNCRCIAFCRIGVADVVMRVLSFFSAAGGFREMFPSFFPRRDIWRTWGMVAACAEYRVHSRHGTNPFDAVRDGKSAVRWMRREAGRLGIKPDRILAGGGSAGGHMAACSALISGFEEAGEDAEISSEPNGLILFNPVLDTTERGYGLEKVTQERKTEISPCHHVRPGLPPTLIMHGEADMVAPYENAERFAKQMEEAGNSCRLVSYEGRGHGFFNRKISGAAVDEADFLSTLREAEVFLRENKFLPAKI